MSTDDTNGHPRWHLKKPTTPWMHDADAAGLSRLDYSAVIAHARGREAQGPE